MSSIYISHFEKINHKKACKQVFYMNILAYTGSQTLVFQDGIKIMLKLRLIQQYNGTGVTVRTCTCGIVGGPNCARALTMPTHLSGLI